VAHGSLEAFGLHLIKRGILLLVLAAALAAGAAASKNRCLAQPAPARELDGTWLTADGAAMIRFEACAPSRCGRLVWLRDPIDPETGAQLLDKNNPDPALRTRQLLGIALITDVTPVRQDEWQAKAYNAEDAGTYAVTLRLAAPDRLALRGCGLAGLICRTEFWSRAQR
jgi:uncharacterized protein (DUF2147 family)